MGRDSSMMSCGPQGPAVLNEPVYFSPPLVSDVKLASIVQNCPPIRSHDFALLRGVLFEYVAGGQTPASWPNGEPQKIRDACDAKTGGSR